MLRRIQFLLLITPDLQDFQFYAFTMKQTKKITLNRLRTAIPMDCTNTLRNHQKMSPLPVLPSHLRPTCHLEREARQQSLTHQAVSHLPVLHKAPAKRCYRLWLFGVTKCHVTRSREKILVSARSDSHSHRIQL